MRMDETRLESFFIRSGQLNTDQRDLFHKDPRR